eukprot:CAMPEP_0114261026 /NCGR_PEP_ID=MMETSP0058-20121206/20867_1 /TAXON_ID=36894 /ORGANISM="Pyramimonas parkeae, CCMP726" /LENGTH=198 /DNA_ID=CAMNT_0001376433 /DNA_START=52 /DNA_END=648 /DNA_ORIENTATION=-
MAFACSMPKIALYRAPQYVSPSHKASMAGVSVGKPSVRVAARAAPRLVIAASEGKEDEPVFDTLTTPTPTTPTTTSAEAPSLQEGIQSVSDFTSMGYTQGDSAGQSNIFSVEPKMYVSDGESQEQVTNYSAIAGGIAAVVLVGGLVALQSVGGQSADEAIVSTSSLQSIYEQLSGDPAPWVEVPQAAPPVALESGISE